MGCGKAEPAVNHSPSGPHKPGEIRGTMMNKVNEFGPVAARLLIAVLFRLLDILRLFDLLDAPPELAQAA